MFNYNIGVFLPIGGCLGGGGTSSGGDISLNDTIGQPVIGPSSGGDMSLHAGYWVSGIESEPEYPIYLHLVMR